MRHGNASQRRDTRRSTRRNKVQNRPSWYGDRVRADPMRQGDGQSRADPGGTRGTVRAEIDPDCTENLVRDTGKSYSDTLVTPRKLSKQRQTL